MPCLRVYEIRIPLLPQLLCHVHSCQTPLVVVLSVDVPAGATYCGSLTGNKTTKKGACYPAMRLPQRWLNYITTLSTFPSAPPAPATLRGSVRCAACSWQLTGISGSGRAPCGWRSREASLGCGGSCQSRCQLAHQPSVTRLDLCQLCDGVLHRLMRAFQ